MYYHNNPIISKVSKILFFPIEESVLDQSAAEERYKALLSDSNCIEKSFPVDRRKLERLILGGHNEFGVHPFN